MEAVLKRERWAVSRSIRAKRTRVKRPIFIQYLMKRARELAW